MSKDLRTPVSDFQLVKSLCSSVMYRFLIQWRCLWLTLNRWQLCQMPQLYICKFGVPLFMYWLAQGYQKWVSESNLRCGLMVKCTWSRSRLWLMLQVTRTSVVCDQIFSISEKTDANVNLCMLFKHFEFRSWLSESGIEALKSGKSSVHALLFTYFNFWTWLRVSAKRL